MVRVAKPEGRVACVEWEKPPLEFWAELRKKEGIHDFEKSELVEILCNSGLRQIHMERIPVLHRRPNVPEKLVKKSQLLTLTIMGLDKEDGQWFFPKIREEYQRLPVDEKHGWLPVLYAGTKPSKTKKKL